MTSFFVTMCDAIALELTLTVAGLSEVVVHKYGPWNPEELVGDGQRHLGVWPLVEAEVAGPLTNYEHEMDQNYSVLIWEDNPTESSRQAEDEEGSRAFLNLHEDIKQRFYVEANQRLGDADRVWYAGTNFPERSQSVRWFRLIVNVKRIESFV